MRLCFLTPLATWEDWRDSASRSEFAAHMGCTAQLNQRASRHVLPHGRLIRTVAFC